MSISIGLLIIIGTIVPIKNNIRCRLVKNNYITNFEVIEKPDILKTLRKIPNYSTIKEEIQEIINRFYIKLAPEVSKESMEIIKKNLKSIKSDSNYDQSIILNLRSAGGEYNPFTHEIKENQFITSINIEGINEGRKLFQKIISHELMHAASSHNYDNNVIVGFHQRSLKPIYIDIGTAINEGYTELLSNRYIIDKDLNIRGRDTGYKYEVSVAELVELIVDKENMINMYFQGDLGGLVKELTKYQEETKVKQFIIDLDTILFIRRNKHIYEKEEILQSLYNRINIFLYKAFTNKFNNTNYHNIDKYLEDTKHFIEIFSKIEQNNISNKKIKK